MIFRFHVKFPGCMPNDFDSLSLDHGKYQEYAVMAALRQVNRLWQKSNLRVGQESSFLVTRRKTKTYPRNTPED